MVAAVSAAKEQLSSRCTSCASGLAAAHGGGARPAAAWTWVAPLAPGCLGNRRLAAWRDSGFLASAGLPRL